MLAPASLYTASTGLCADSVEAHPSMSGVFALGTYHVDKESAQAEELDGNTSISPAYTRRGTVTLYKVTKTPVPAKVNCHPIHQQFTPAILDMKWFSIGSTPGSLEQDILSVATATGCVDMFKLLGSQQSMSLKKDSSWYINPRKSLCLSLDWSNRRQNRVQSTLQDQKLIVSQSDGTLAFLPSVLRCLNGDASPQTVLTREEKKNFIGQGREWSGDEEEDGNEDADQAQAHALLNDPAQWEQQGNGQNSYPAGLETWKAHDNEAWIAAWDCWSHGTVAWSGADDLTLKGWDMRTPNRRTGRKPTFITRKGFDGGVTALESHHMREHIWAVGSYDSRLRIFDARQPARPVIDRDGFDVEGGIWRVKWHPTDADTLLVGAMHGGFKVLSIPPADQKGRMELLSRFDEHESIGYGCDWDRGDLLQEGGDTLVYSASFYDARLHIWSA
ncbi:hypothetical protein K437DRAFT_228024 [Tilletiaria anomala UBC 951]|uniref:methylated diphthine methylhydrolase n=1 Tax=Tilletiaria anomala (strain ATCC 24038 / CBS 436.72 / UBC 951) TaxID=1037660 RepID=A0A066VD78_TILAU|nr:uncharacterized protein K437DRAFT_228024 [Tilletiaria anomala UBC 951]KDN39386.1 hypothetical protein K437DRAFT_228024 [Tilletiaria anomala UBC 951]